MTVLARVLPRAGLARDGYLPEIFTLGHRTPLGLAVHPGAGQVWETENGPNASDEVNVLVPGGNYGWPLVSLGRTYQGQLGTCKSCAAKRYLRTGATACGTSGRARTGSCRC